MLRPGSTERRCRLRQNGAHPERRASLGAKGKCGRTCLSRCSARCRYGVLSVFDHAALHYADDWYHPESSLPKMIKSELIARLAEHYPRLTAKDVEVAVKTMLDAMTMSLVKGRRIEIRGFGSFGLNYRPPRTGRNPKSGDRVQVPEKYLPHFKPGRELRERVDT